MIQMMDMADPSNVNVPAGYKAVAGYLPSDYAHHVWGKKDWAKYIEYKKLPIYVGSVAVGPAKNPEDEGFSVLRSLYGLKVPHGTAVAIDMEMAVDRAWLIRIAATLHWGGYLVWKYGSQSTIFQNPKVDGTWVAWYRGIGPFMDSRPGVRATQWTNGPQFDSSTVKWWAWKTHLRKW